MVIMIFEEQIEIRVSFLVRKEALDKINRYDILITPFDVRRPYLSRYALAIVEVPVEFQRVLYTTPVCQSYLRRMDSYPNSATI